MAAVNCIGGHHDNVFGSLFLTEKAYAELQRIVLQMPTPFMFPTMTFMSDSSPKQILPFGYKKATADTWREKFRYINVIKLSRYR